MDHEMLRRLLSRLRRPKHEVTAEDVAAAEYAEDVREWKRTQRAMHNLPPGFGTDPMGSEPDEKHRPGG
jgi:hypothetical protein